MSGASGGDELTRAGRGGADDASARRGLLNRRAFLARGAAAIPVAGGAGALLAACGSSGGSSGGGGGGGGGGDELTFALFQNPDTLDPAGTSLVGATQVLTSMFEPLTWYIPGHGDEHPAGLALSYDVSRDATTYTFKLRHGVTFHDGSPFNADSVKATFDHIVAPATQAKSELGELGPYKQTRIIDPYTVQVMFKAPNASFANEMGSISMMSAAALKKYGAHIAQHPVGTGPFMFESFVNGQQVTVKRYPKYNWAPSVLHHSGPAPLKRLTFRVLPDPSAQFDALRTGELQIAQSLTPTDVLAAEKTGQFKRFVADAAGLPYSMIINTQHPPTDDVRVRQALIHATNDPEIVKILYKGIYNQANSLLTPATLGYRSSQALYHYDPARAGTLLDQAGWTKGSGGTRSKNGTPLQLTILNASNFGFDDISQLMQSQLTKVGIKCTIADQAFPAVNATYSKGEMNLSDWFYADVDPSCLGTLFSCDNIGTKGTGFNDARICSTAVDGMLARGNAETDLTKRAAIYDRAVVELMRQAVAVPIYNLRYNYVGPKTMSGLAALRDGTPLFQAVRL